MNTTPLTMTLTLALAGALLAAAGPAQAAPIHYGSYAGTTGGASSGGEGSFSAMANTPSYYKHSYAWAMGGWAMARCTRLPAPRHAPAATPRRAPSPSPASGTR